jgi:23S rRNA (guanosine2251-2'-O)-methyltransferase
VLALDHLQDPQNFGALCRSAEAFGASAILLPKDRGVQVTPGVYHASVGAVETVPIVLVANLGEALRRLKETGYWVVGSAIGGGAKPPWETPDFAKTILVLGAELEGMSQLIEKTCDWKVEIPMAGDIQSLNVSAAGAVLLYELTRPNRAPQ